VLRLLWNKHEAVQMDVCKCSMSFNNILLIFTSWTVYIYKDWQTILCISKYNTHTRTHTQTLILVHIQPILQFNHLKRPVTSAKLDPGLYFFTDHRRLEPHSVRSHIAVVLDKLYFYLQTCNRASTCQSPKTLALYTVTECYGRIQLSSLKSPVLRPLKLTYSLSRHLRQLSTGPENDHIIGLLLY